MDTLTKSLANPFQPNNTEPMDTVFLQQLQQALTAVQIVQCLQSAREELENKHLPAQMSQLASYLTVDPLGAQPSLSNQEGNRNFHSLTTPSKSQTNHPLDIISESSEALSDSVGCPVSPISHLPSITNKVSSVYGKSMASGDFRSQSVNGVLCPTMNSAQNIMKYGSDISGNEKKFFIDADFEIHEDENEWIDNVLLNDEHDFPFNQDNNPSTSLVDNGVYQNSNLTSELHDGNPGIFRDSNQDFSSFEIQNGEAPCASGVKRKRSDEAEIGNGNSVKLESDSPSGQRTNSSPCKGMRPRQPRGTATDPQSVSARKRRERISKKIRTLQELVPNARSMDTASMLEQAIYYVRNLEEKVQRLKCKKIRV